MITELPKLSGSAQQKRLSHFVLSLVGRWAAYFSHSVIQAGRGFISMHASKKCGNILKLPSASAICTWPHLTPKGAGKWNLPRDGHFTSELIMAPASYVLLASASVSVR